MSDRSIRRAAERKAAKLARKQERADINRANAQFSTGPKSVAGKARSSQNAFKHGLYSDRLILPGESAVEFDALRADLRAQHQPVNTTEEILVDEIAQSFWRMRRFKAVETACWESDRMEQACESGLLKLAMRALAAAERSMYKAISVLRGLQKDRGFVPSPVETTATETQSEAADVADSYFPPPRDPKQSPTTP